jgi:hypothetical protein
VRHATELQFDDMEVIEANRKTQAARTKRIEAKAKRMNEKVSKLEAHEGLTKFFSNTAD